MGTPSSEEPLEQLSLSRHRDLEGRHCGFKTWLRRGITAILLLFVVLAARNQFGQSATTSVTSSSAAELKVGTPLRLRSGLIFQTRVQLTARRTIAHPTIVLDDDWFDGMTLN